MKMPNFTGHICCDFFSKETVLKLHNTEYDQVLIPRVLY